MKGYLLLILVLFTIPVAGAVEIKFSSLEASEISVDQAGQLQLIISHEGEVVAEKTLDVSGPGVKVVEWDLIGETGQYTLNATLFVDGEAVASDSLRFLHGGSALPRFHLKEVSADSRGFSVLLQAFEPVIADVDVMLVRGDDVIFAQEAGRVSLIQPAIVEGEWKVLLEDGTQYGAWVKATQKEPQEVVTGRLVRFTAREDVEITDVFEDETGASATVLGQSRVPFGGQIRFRVYNGGRAVEEVSVKGPAVITGDDDTVEVQWSKRLPEGRYNLRVVALSSGGDVLDEHESVIEAEEAPPTPEVTPTEAPGPGVLIALFSLAVARRLLG